MPLVAEASTMSITLTVFTILLSLLLMFVVLIQRGKGGGLAGAFGGVGGSSPFGSRAGDAFTKFTLYLAGVWVLVIMVTVTWANRDRPQLGPEQAPAVNTQPGGD